jgi:hypothetical protein
MTMRYSAAGSPSALHQQGVSVFCAPASREKPQPVFSTDGVGTRVTWTPWRFSVFSALNVWWMP